MESKETYSYYISHFEKQLFESYSILEDLEFGLIKPVNEFGKEKLQLTIKSIKYFCFFTASFLDIATTLKKLNDIESGWERKYHLKNGFVSIYETIITFNKHNNDIKLIIDKDYQEIAQRYTNINQILRKFKKMHKFELTIQKFRNNAGAHYAEDFNVYYKSLITIDNQESIITIYDFSNFLKILISFWSDFVDLQENK